MAVVDLGSNVQGLSPADIRRLRISRWSTTSLQRLLEILEAYPRRSIWQPSSGEYAVVTGWRHRPEIAQLFELAAPRDPVALTTAAMAAARIDGAELFIAIETDSARRPAFYERLGLTLMDQVISLEHPSPQATRSVDEQVRPLRDLDPQTMSQLLRLDAAAFPWLWRNSEVEFRSYVEEPGVELYAIDVDGGIGGYIGVTAFLGWGHIDRVAIDPTLQRRGLGRRLTSVGVDRLVRLGARRVGLSTQISNVPARQLYEKLGFARQLATDYRLYGRWLTDPADPFDIEP